MVSVRRLGRGDEKLMLSAVDKIKSEGAVPKELSRLSPERFLEAESNIFMAAIGDDGSPVGFLLSYRLPRIDTDRMMILIYELEVAHEHRGQGVGRKLLEGLKELLADDDILKMWVLTNRSNRAAVKLYQTCGGRFGGGEDMVMLEFYPPPKSGGDKAI